MTTQSSIIKDILTKLESGKELTLSFPTPREREAFRVAIYKEKRNLDENLLMSDPIYECDELSFEKKFYEDRVNAYIATLAILPKGSHRLKQRRDYTFIIEEEVDINTQTSKNDEQFPTCESKGESSNTA